MCQVSRAVTTLSDLSTKLLALCKMHLTAAAGSGAAITARMQATPCAPAARSAAHVVAGSMPPTATTGSPDARRLA